MLFKVVIIAIFSISAKPTPLKKESKITWAFDPWAPFHKLEPKSKKANGILVELVNEAIVKKLSLDLKYKELPWKRAQHEVKSGSSDFIVTVPTKERAEYSIASKKPIYLLENKVYYHKSNKKNQKTISEWKSIEEIRKSSLTGVTQIGDGWWKKELKGVKTEYVRDLSSVLKMLASGRADFAIISEVEALELIKQKYKKNDFISGSVVDSSPFHILISKKSLHKNKITAINKYIDELEQKFKTIIKNFSH
jgi:polar amino acid transport system substrate-binding protein